MLSLANGLDRLPNDALDGRMLLQESAMVRGVLQCLCADQGEAQLARRPVRAGELVNDRLL